MYIIAVFRSRKETLDLMKKLEYNRAKCTIINTPRMASSSCGISVKFDSRVRLMAEHIIANSDYNTFMGLFEVNDNRVSRLN